MNNKEFLSSLNEIEAKFIEEAADYKAKNNRKTLVRWISIAACICLVATAIGYAFLGKPKEERFKQGDIFISETLYAVSPTTSASMEIYTRPISFHQLKNRMTEASEDDDIYSHNNNLVCKGTVAGGSFQEHNYEWNLYSVVSNAILYTPIRVEEIYYQGDQMDVEVKVGDIIYVGQYMCVFTEELLEHYPNALEFFSAKNIGDIYMRDGRNYEYKEMLFRKDDSYLLMLDGKEGRTFEHNGKEYFFSPALSPMLNVFNLSREPKTADEHGIKIDFQINRYNNWLEIRKDAIDYYINGNKEILS